MENVTKIGQAEIVRSTADMTEDDWRLLRNTGLGGSDAAAAVGLSKWKSQMQLYMEKTGQYEYVVNNDAVYWGKVLEAPIANRFAEVNPDVTVEEVKALLRHPEYPFMQANIDRLIRDTKTGLPIGILEVKTTSARNADAWDEDAVPTDYVCQVQHYLAVTGLPVAYVVCLIGGRNYVQRRVERDEELISLLIEKEKEFWTRIETATPPEWDGSEASERFLKELNKEGDVVAQSIKLDTSYGELCRKYKELEAACKEQQDVLSQLEKSRNAYKEKIAYALGENAEAEAGDYKVKYTLVNVKAHTVPASSYRRFSIRSMR